MPNKFCYFGCNRYKKLSVFSVPKNEVLRNEWQKSLDVDLFDNDVICEEHFCAEQIKKTNDFLNKFGKIICSAPLLRPRLMPNAVPSKCLNGKSFETRENSPIEDLHRDSDSKLLQNSTNCIFLEHNYSSVPYDGSIHLKSSSSVVFDFKKNTTKTCQENGIIREPLDFNEKSNDQSILFNELINWDLYLPPNWQKYLSHDKKCFGISEIVFIKQGDNFNSFLRKSITISQCNNNVMNSITCNVLGKSINKLVNFNGYVESQDQLQKLIKEIALLKICKGVDLINTKKYNPFIFINDSILLDTMQKKRHLECQIIISNGSHCLYCARMIRNIYQRQRRLTEHSSPKQSSLITIPKKKKKFNMLQKRNNLLRKNRIVLKNK